MAAPKRGPGRPTFLSPEMTKEICLHVSLGLTLHDAATLAGIETSTLMLWQAKGRDGEPKYVEFFNSLQKARATGKRNNLGLIAAAGRKDWKASAWMMERQHPTEYAPRVVHWVREELTQALNRLREVFLDELSPEKLLTPGEAYELALASLTGEGAPASAPPEEDGRDDHQGGEAVVPPPSEPDPARLSRTRLRGGAARRRSRWR